jgi:hypothetical protein
MKITKTQLKQIIKEELREAREPYQLDDFGGMDTSAEGGTSSIEREYIMDIDDVVSRALQDENVEALHQIAYALEDSLVEVYEAIKERGAHSTARLGTFKSGR